MRIERHPDVSTLLTCAAGSQPEALCAVVASHICVCPKCFRALRQMHEIGVVLFDTITPVVMSAPAPLPPKDLVSNRMTQPRPVSLDSEIPSTLHAVLGKSLNSLPWKSVSPGVEHYVVPLSPAAQGDLRLIKLAPGATIPEHGHTGEELSMVLRGSYRDALGTYAVGDLLEADDEARHELIASETVGCILLVASERTPQFAMQWAA